MKKYEAGYISISTGSDVVEGFGTRWLTYVKSNDQLILGGLVFSIQSVTDNHLLKLSTVYTGEPLDRANYEIQVAPVVKTLQQLQSEAMAEIDRQAGIVRLKYITDAPGQQLTYSAKLDSANAYIAAGYPADASPYPWIDQEAIQTGSSPAVVADLIVFMAEQWTVVGAQIEGHRLAAKRAIDDATSETGISVAELAFQSAIALL
jgi:hypothetical protein